MIKRNRFKSLYKKHRNQPDIPQTKFSELTKAEKQPELKPEPQSKPVKMTLGLAALGAALASGTKTKEQSS
jgi:hypothetical protein